VTPLDPELAGGVCILRVPSKSRNVVDRLYAEHGIAGAGTGGLRLCPHVYNTMEHVERAIAGVVALRTEIG
jgi:selenocysteine lyase/cysteine desulfurase